MLAKGVERPTLELPPSLEVNVETLPRRLLFQLLAEERCVAVVLYGKGEYLEYPYILVQYAADPEWQVRHCCGRICGAEMGMATHIWGVCCEGPPGTPLPRSTRDNGKHLFTEKKDSMKFISSGCELLRAVGVEVAKGKGFSVLLVEGDSGMLW